MSINDALDFKIFKVKQLDESFQYTFLNSECDGNFHLMKNLIDSKIESYGRYHSIYYLKKFRVQIYGKKFLEKN